MRFDINHRSDGFLIYIKVSLPSKILTKFKLPINIQIIPFEINLREEKWLFVSIYKPPITKQSIFPRYTGIPGGRLLTRL